MNNNHNRYLESIFDLEQKKLVSHRALSRINYPSSAVLSHALKRLELFIYAYNSREVNEEFSNLFFPLSTSINLKSHLSSEDYCTLVLSFIYGYLTKQFPTPFTIDYRFPFRIVDWSEVKNVRNLKKISNARSFFQSLQPWGKKSLLPLYANFVLMEVALEQFEKARGLCQNYLQSNPGIAELWVLYGYVEMVNFFFLKYKNFRS